MVVKAGTKVPGVKVEAGTFGEWMVKVASVATTPGWAWEWFPRLGKDMAKATDGEHVSQELPTSRPQQLAANLEEEKRAQNQRDECISF